MRRPWGGYVLGIKFTKTFTLFFILIGPLLAQGQLQVSPDWFTYNTGGGSHTYSWQADQKHFEALAYNVSAVLFDLHNFDCFDSANPQKCLNNFQRCPVPRTKSDGTPDVGSWDTFMDNFDIPDYDVFPTLGSDPLEDLGYCTDQKQMIGEYSTTIMTSPVINKNFAPSYLSNRQGFFLDSYAAVPKAIRRSASAIAKQMMNGIKFGLPVTVGPDTPAKAKMNCDGSGGYINFKNFRNFAEYNFDKELPAGNDTRRQIKGPIGFYDCAQREIGNNNYVTPPNDEVEYTLRDRGNNPDFKCVDKRDQVYFEEEDCIGYAYINLGSNPTPKDFYRYRSNVNDIEQAVVDLTQAPYSFGSSALGMMLDDDPGGYDNPENTSKTMHNFLEDFAISTGGFETEKKSIVVSYFTEILDRTIYYVKDDEIFRRTLKFGYTGGSTSLPANYENYITHEFTFANASSAPKSKMIPTSVAPFYSCINLSNPARAALVGDHFGYLDRIAGTVQDYSGYVMRPYREINTNPSNATEKRALFVNTIKMKAFGPPEDYGDGYPYDGDNWNEFLDFIKLYYPFARTPMVRELGYPLSSPASGSGPGFDNVNKPSGPYDNCQGINLDTILNGGSLYLDPSPPAGMLCQVVCPGPVSGIPGSCRQTGSTSWQAKCDATCYRDKEEYESKPWTITRREWWTEDSIADKSGFLNVLTCSPDENMIALGKEDPMTTFTTTPGPYPGYRASPPALNPLSGNAYCSSLDGSDPAKCIRPGGGGFKEDFNKYCVRYLVGKKVRRDEVSGETAYGPFGNVLADMSALSLGVVGGAMVCEDDEIYVKKASASATQGPYMYAAKHPNGLGGYSNYNLKLDNDAYFFKEAKDSPVTPGMDIDVILETKFDSPGPSTGREMTIPARSLGLGNPSAKLPMLYGLCVRPKLELDYPTLRMGPLSLPFRNYIVDYMILNTDGGASVPPNCP